MKLEIGGGKEIAITEHSVWCVFQIPNARGDPPYMSDDEAHFKHRQLGEQICGSAYNPKLGISVSDVLQGLVTKTLTENLAQSVLYALSNHCYSQTLTLISGLRM